MASTQPPGGFFSPGNIWLGLGVLALVIGGIKVLTPAPPADDKTVALLNVVDAGQTRIQRVTEAECRKQAERVWAASDDGVECIAYVAAGPTQGFDTAVVFLNGDVSERDVAERSQAAARETNLKWATSVALRHEVPVVFVGRPGLMGSTGFHLLGGRRDEAEILNSALDQIKTRLGIRRLAMAGQSGGARIIAQLLAMGRRDIHCAAMSSGAYDLPRLRGGGVVSTNIFGDPGRSLHVPMRHAERVPVEASRRAFVIGDARDRNVPFSEQSAWADKLAGLGHHAMLIEADATDTEFHGLAQQALTAAAMCARGRSDAEIKSAVQVRSSKQ